MAFPWPPLGSWLRAWRRTWYAPCDDVTTPGAEFRWIQVLQLSVDRLTSFPVQPAKDGNAMRVEVQHGDVAWDTNANKLVDGGWRAEAVGPTESQSSSPVRYEWSTMLDPTYVVDPRVDDTNSLDNGKRIWQVIFQWHQGENDRGGSPPIAFIIVGNEILLDVQRYDPADQLKSIQVGQWPVANLDRGEWHDFLVQITWRTSKGTIKVWHNGEPVTFSPQVQPGAPNLPLYPAQETETLTGLGTLFPPKTGSTAPPSSYMKVGLYRRPITTKPPGPFVLYHDEVSRYEPGRWVPEWWHLIPRIRLPGR